MTQSLGDFPVDGAVTFLFTTHAATGGAVAPLSAFEIADVRIYKDSSATQRTSSSGMTMTSPFDSVTGLHHVAIDLTDNTDAGFFVEGSQYHVVLVPDTETVDGQTVVSVLATFGITVNSATILADAVNNKIGTLPDFGSGTTLGDNVLDIFDSVDNVAGVLGAAGAGLTAIPWNAAWDAEVQSEANDALVANGLDHLVGASVTGTDITDNSIIAKIVSKSATADWDSFVNTTDALEALRDNVGSAGVGLTAIPTVALVTTVTNLTNLPAAAATAAELAKVPKSDSTVTWNATALASINAEVVDVLRTDTIPDSYATDGSAPTIAQAILAIQQFLQERSVSGTTVTVKKPDGTTTAMTFTLNDGTNPTSITRAT